VKYILLGESHTKRDRGIMKKTQAGLLRSMFLNLEAFIAAVIIVAFTFNLAEAREHVLVDISNDETTNRISLVIETDKNNNEILFLHKDVFDSKKSKRLERKTTNIKRASHQNFEKIVLEQKGKYEVVYLTSDNFALHNGGDLTIDTLLNGATGKRKQYEVELLRSGNTWILERNGKRISSMHFTSNKVAFLGTVGVSNMITK
jgi:hypothetical protein